MPMAQIMTRNTTHSPQCRREWANSRGTSTRARARVPSRKTVLRRSQRLLKLTCAPSGPTIPPFQDRLLGCPAQWAEGSCKKIQITNKNEDASINNSGAAYPAAETRLLHWKQSGFQDSRDRLGGVLALAPPDPHPVEVEVDHRRGEQGEHLAERSARRRWRCPGAGAARSRCPAEGQGQGAEQGGHGGHHDGPEAQQAGLVDGLLRGACPPGAPPPGRSRSS